MQNKVLSTAMTATAVNDGKKLTHNKSSPTMSTAVAKWVLANFLPCPKANIMGEYGAIRVKFIIVTIRNNPAA